MTLTILDSGNYPEQTTRDLSEKISIWKLPRILWIALVIFAVNILVGTGVFVTSDIRPNHAAYSVSGRPSPFTETVDTARHKVRVAAKLRPVSFVSAPLGTLAPPDSTFSLTPQPVAYSPDRSYEVRGVINGMPRAVSDKENKFLLIN